MLLQVIISFKLQQVSMDNKYLVHAKIWWISAQFKPANMNGIQMI